MLKFAHSEISGQITNDKTQTPKTPIQKMLSPTPKPKPQTQNISGISYILSLLRGIMTRYLIQILIHFDTHRI